ASRPPSPRSRWSTCFKNCRGRRSMTRRSRAREVALQLLFGQDHNAQQQRAEIERFVRERLREPALREFCLGLYNGVLGHLADIDQRISAAVENWRWERMAMVDRYGQRMGAYG